VPYDKILIKPAIHVYPNQWPRQAADAMQAVIDETIASTGMCSVMLTGGNSAQNIYQVWATNPDFPHKDVTYYFGDERCVAVDNPDSNFGVACRSLFPGGVPDYVQIHPMEGDSNNCENAAGRYEDKMPINIDVLLLGMGEDGHVASLFPGDPILKEILRRVMPVIGPKLPSRRLTITPKVIAEARTVFLLATGAQKGKVLAKVLNEMGSIQDLPVRCAIGATWLLDQAAGDEIYKDSV
jgi:6-phosphogluconolactonase